MYNLQKLVVRGGAMWPIHLTAGLLEHFRYDTGETMGRKIKEVVHESTSTIQSLSEILMIVDRAPHTPTKCEVFKVSAQAGLILDIDIAGLQSREKLQQVLQKQRNSFFSAGQLLHS